MKLSAKLAAVAGMCLFAMTAASQAATLNFTGYIDNVAPGERAVISNLSNATYLSTYTVAAHGSTVAAVGSPVPVGFDNYGSAPQAYLDGGGAGIGVCKVVSGTQCDPTSDDNVTGPLSGGGNPEVLSTSFTNAANDAAFLVSDLIFKNEGHIFSFPSNKHINISTDGTTWVAYLLATTGGGLATNPIFSLLAGQFLHFQYVDQQFYLSSLSIIRDPGQIGEVPIPAALPLLMGGLAGLGALARLRRRSGNAAA